MTVRGALVTGAAGFAGSHLIDHLLELDDRVIGWHHSGGRPPDDRHHGRVIWRGVEVTDADSVARALDDLRPSAVYHLAGVADVQVAWADSARALRVNVMGTDALLKGLERAAIGVPVLVTGSALVYRPSTEALTEESPLGPSSPYAVSKLAQEMLALSSPQHVLVARPFNHAGPRQSAAYVTSSFARQIAAAERGAREPVLRVGNLDARRDVTDVRDTVRAYRSLVERGRPHQPYNICRGETYRVGDLLELLLRRSTTRIRVEVDKDRLRPSDSPVVLGSAARIKADTGWEPRISIDRTLEDLLAYWRQTVRGADEPS